MYNFAGSVKFSMTLLTHMVFVYLIFSLFFTDIIVNFIIASDTNLEQTNLMNFANS